MSFYKYIKLHSNSKFTSLKKSYECVIELCKITQTAKNIDIEWA